MKIRENISRLNISITTAIDEICKESDCQITYAEINSALTDILKSNLDYELRETSEAKNYQPNERNPLLCGCGEISNTEDYNDCCSYSCWSTKYDC